MVGKVLKLKEKAAPLPLSNLGFCFKETAAEFLGVLSEFNIHISRRMVLYYTNGIVEVLTYFMTLH
jgi:hypothetical protein